MGLSDYLFGRPLATDEEGEQRVGVWAGIPMLGLDALGSAAYGPEAALTLLIPLGAAGVGYIGPISTLIILLLLIVYVSYRQTIAAYPHGGGSYTVAKENLGTKAGLIAAAALLLDYVLVVAVGISAGIGALVSALPVLQPYTLPLCLATLGLITIVNLRGVRESGLAFLAPTYLFIATLLSVLAIGIVKSIASGGRPVPVNPPPAPPSAEAAVSFWILMRAFASGCTAMTGVEAVSNGVAAFKEPSVSHARRTLTVIIALLGVMLAGIAYLCHAYGIGATEPGRPGFESVLSQLVAAVVGRGPFYYVTIGSVLMVLALSANTGFADFPRLCRVVAQDGYLPNAFAHRGRRLVYSQGIIDLAGRAVLSAGLLIAFGGITDNLIPLFAVGAFLARCRRRGWSSTGGRRAGPARARRWRSTRRARRAHAGGDPCRRSRLEVRRRRLGDDPSRPGAPDPVHERPRPLPARGPGSGVGRPSRRQGTTVPPLVLVPVRGWSSITLARPLRFALKISPEIYALARRRRRAGDGRGPGRLAGNGRSSPPPGEANLTPPRLIVTYFPLPEASTLPAPGRCSTDLQRAQPGRDIAQ